MSCTTCAAFDSAERAAIEGTPLPTHQLTCPCDRGAELDVLYVAPDRFRRSPQVGTPCRMSWGSLVAYLARPARARVKGAAGAWSPALYRDNVRRKANLVHACALVVDIDEGGEVERVAEALARYSAVVHSTFSDAPEARRCRVVLALTQALDARTWEQVHTIVRAHLGARGFVADEGAKDASRLSYAPVARPGTDFRFRAIRGEALDVNAVLKGCDLAPRRARERVSVPSTLRDRYARAACERAATAVGRSPEGERHRTLNREAFALARLPIEEVAIAGVLTPAAVAAGLPEREATRVIRDAVRARRRGA